MSELERAVHVERESLLEEINRNRQEAGGSEKRLKERTDEHLAKNLSRLTREAEQRELQLREDMEKLRTQQEQTLGTLDTKADAMMERRTQAIMDRLDGLLGSRSGPREGEPNLGGHNREPNVNLALFSVLRFKKYRNVKNRDLWGDQNIAILTLKTGLLSVLITEKRYRSNNISNTIPLQVCSISELKCLTRIFAVR